MQMGATDHQMGATDHNLTLCRRIAAQSNGGLGVLL
jgi:hypothetical protein